MKFYTSAVVQGNEIWLREVVDGRRVPEKIRYRPHLFTATDSHDTPYRSIANVPMRRVEFESMRDASDALREPNGYYGMDRWSYQFLNARYPGKVEYDDASIVTAIVDIEVAADEGFPDPHVANKPVTAIAMLAGGHMYAFGCHPYEAAGVTYTFCRDEKVLLDEFLNTWKKVDPDIISGWNIERFDIPYLVNRIKRVLGRGSHNRLSPWNKVITKMTKGKPAAAGNGWSEIPVETHFPLGVAVLDYMTLYKNKNIMPSSYEAYSLNAICAEELGEKKLDYSGYENLLDLYRRDFKLFMDYNIRDVKLIEKLEQKRGLIALVISTAYSAKVDYDDVLASSRPWDARIHNYLLDRNVVVPIKNEGAPPRKLLGGYVKKVGPDRAGIYRWVVSFDVKSMYPHIIMMCNISADTIRDKIPGLDFGEIVEIDDDERRREALDARISQLLDGSLGQFRDHLQRLNYDITANGCVYDREQRGFLAEILEDLYVERQRYKDMMLEEHKLFEKTKDPKHSLLAARYNTFQNAAKVALNTGYGCLSNKYFRWFRIDNAEAITSTGQLTIKWAERAINEYLNGVLKTTGVDYVIAIDTDSIYVHLGPLVEQVFDAKTETRRIVDFVDDVCKGKLEPLLDESFQKLAEYLNAPRNRISMKREAICSTAVWTAAKNYILDVHDQEGVRYSSPKLKVVGIKAVMPSTPAVCRVKIREALRIIVEGDKDKLLTFIDKFRGEFQGMPFEDIAFPRNISGLDKYGDDGALCTRGTPIQVRGALVYNYLLRKHSIKTAPPIMNGDKIKYCYLMLPNPVAEHVVAAPRGLPQQFDLDKYIDRETMFDKAFLAPLQSILDTMGWNVNSSEASLESFFI